MFIDHNWKNIKLMFVILAPPASPGEKRLCQASIDKCQMSIKISGKKKIHYKQKNLEFSEGDILFIPMERTRDIDYYQTTVESGDSITIYFSSSELLFEDLEKFSGCSDKIKNLAIRLEKSFNDITVSPFISMQLFYELLYAVQQMIALQDKNHNFNNVVTYIQEHINEPFINIDTLASICGTTKEYFRHSFKKEFGIPPLQYINALKGEQIKMLLLKDYNMEVIASMTGFSTANYLSRFFKKQFGVTPSEYKKIHLDLK